jgi:hypothetical protein
MTYQLGRRPPRTPAEAPRLALGQFLRGPLPPVPAVVDWVSQVAEWPLYGNDQWGCCVFAAAGHMIEAVTTYGRGTGTMPTTDELLAAYSAVTGFDPNAGPPGANDTDQGTVIQDALSYWRKAGIAGHRILAFAEVDVHNITQVDSALALFGHLMIGVNFPAIAMDQFNAGQPWTTVTDDGGIDGGHAVDLGYDATGTLKVITWARVQTLTPAWWERYVEEAWVIISPEWLTAAGANPAGIDLHALGDAFTTLTGQPFPAMPTPTPPPAGDPADHVLVAALDHWSREHHVANNARAAHAYQAWKTAKGL